MSSVLWKCISTLHTVARHMNENPPHCMYEGKTIKIPLHLLCITEVCRGEVGGGGGGKWLADVYDMNKKWRAQN